MENSTKRLILIVAVACVISCLVSSVVTYALVSRSVTVVSVGVVLTVNVGVYRDPECTQNLTAIDWGKVPVGGSVDRTIYLKNTGTAPITLGMTLTGWLPSGAEQYIDITWDRQDVVLAAGESCAATLTLSVSQDITGITNFSVNIVVTGTYE